MNVMVVIIVNTLLFRSGHIYFSLMLVKYVERLGK